ncbi:hybrid sensor histidine kinase/response regulator transcription factor [Mucilaginibacter gynuensis]|uniref:histidine kinase n=1 Tax=Mucilaginibacter gynuensis TaxID=1302236 RepID=A0ABP8G5A5_9SPHI
MRVLPVFLFIVSVCFGFNAAGQVWQKSAGKQFDPGNYALKTYTINDGLPSKSTTAALKDERGFMWIGTENGLCKFDGYSFKTFVNTSGDSSTITNNNITALAEDKKGRIWVGTMDGLNIFDPLTEKFERFYHQDNNRASLSNNKVWALLADRQGMVWIGTDDGFNLFNEKTRTFTVFRPDAGNPYAMKGKSVNAIIEDKANNLWLGNWSGGLNKFDKRSRHFSNYKQQQAPGQKNPNDIWSLCYAGDGQIWVGTYWKGLFKFNPATAVFTAWPCGAQNNTTIYNIGNAGKHELLVSGNTGFYWLNTNGKQQQKIEDLASLSNGDIYTDRGGIVWICAKDGLTKLDFKQYKFNLLPLSLRQKEVKDFTVRDSVFWIATNNGLLKFDYKKGTNTTFTHNANPKSLASSEILRLYFDSRNTLWVLTENGFDQFDQNTNTFLHHQHHSAIGSLFNEDVFRDILEVNPGEYYLATDAGLKIYNSKTGGFTHYYNDSNNPASLSNNHLYCLQKNAVGDVWIGTSGGGLNRFNQKTRRFRTYMINNKARGGISSNTVNNIFMDSHKNLWICTPDGLNKYDGKSDSFTVYSKNNGFASNVFTNITEDKRGNLWTTTGKGIAMFNPATLEVKNFDEADGVYVNTILSKVPSGEMYIAGNDGVVYFDPLNIKYNRDAPPVYFSDFQVFNKTVLPGKKSPLKESLTTAGKIVLNYSQSVFSLEFVALNYSHSEKNEYAYQLQGFDKKWNYVGKQRKATYTNLNPGEYVLHVKASNNDGLWNEKGRSITIIITPPWYKTWWAYLLYLATVCGIIYAYILYRDRQAKLKYEIQIAHMEGEKEKELSEKKLSFFTNISHEFRTPLTLIINPVKELLYKDDKNVDTTNLNIVYRNARRLLSLVDQLLLFRKADAEADKLNIACLNLVNLAKEVFLCFTHQARTKNITFEFDCAEDYIEVYADREKMEIVLFNLLSNAIKFTPEGGTVKVTVSLLADAIQIAIADTGCGITEEAGEKLYNRFYQDQYGSTSVKGGFGIGLYLVKSFIEGHGGNISYKSKINEGTTFSITLLKGRNHLPADLVLDNADTGSVFLKELIEDEITANQLVEAADENLYDEQLATDNKSLLIIDDNNDIREYIKQVFKLDYILYEADNGEDGYRMIKEHLPDIVICDVMMQGMSGIELCNLVKEDITISHVPIVLLTASASPEIKLKGIEGGADDYISKPFDKEILKARVAGILKSKNNLQKYFYNEITLNSNNLRISAEYKDFLDNCIRIVELHITEPDFTIQVLADEIGMSRSNLYKKIKSVSGQSANGFIRFIRLRKAAEIFINTDNTILETSYLVGINDAKYFREQFNKVFNMNPSQYIKKYRKPFSNNLNLSPELARAGRR